MSSITDYKVIHNGYDIRYFPSMNDVENYISGVLQPHFNLSPEKIMDRKIKSSNKTIRIVRYRYYTLYEEDFIIEEP